eukprot:scaffold665134_cov74-Prasinocladus_malaysianus.AAC.2
MKIPDSKQAGEAWLSVLQIAGLRRTCAPTTNGSNRPAAPCYHAALAQLSFIYVATIACCRSLDQFRPDTSR